MFRTTLFAVALACISASAFGKHTALFPVAAETSHASASAVTFFQDYFTAKSRHDADALLKHFGATTAYFDAVVGIAMTNRSVLVQDLTALTKQWPEGAHSYPFRILGDTNSAVLYSEDEPGLFGATIRILSAVNFDKHGKIERFVDYWDGRNNVVANGTVPDDQYPNDLGISKIKPSTAAPKMKAIVRRLHAALLSHNATAVAALFDYNAILEDRTLHTRLEGIDEITGYLQRTIALLPYASNTTTVRNVLGNVQGGGYEWANEGARVRNGLIALELGVDGKTITRFTSVWDGNRLDAAAIAELAVKSAV